jgi:hypothetical protein
VTRGGGGGLAEGGLQEVVTSNKLARQYKGTENPKFEARFGFRISDFEFLCIRLSYLF